MYIKTRKFILDSYKMFSAKDKTYKNAYGNGKIPYFRV